MLDHAVPLSEYLKTCSQKALAEKLGMTQAAISKMVRRNRRVFVGVKQGRVHAYELRNIGSTK